MGYFLAIIFSLVAFSTTSFASEKIKVVTSFSILADMIRNVGGDYIDVINLVGADEDAHVYEPTPDTGKTLLNADIIITNGLGFEPWLDRLMASTETTNKKIVASRGVLPLWLEHDGEKIPDPHAWQSLPNAEIYVRNITAALSKMDPKHSAEYQKQRDIYLEKITVLLLAAKVAVDQLPASKRKIITSHDAFGYFGQIYKITFLAPQGLSTSDEPSAAEVAALIRQMRAEKVQAVFVENIRDSRLIKQIAEETNARIGGTLYSDALAAQGPASTYLGMYQYNLDTLLKALE